MTRWAKRAYDSVMQESLARQRTASTTFAKGWYLISWSTDLKPGGVMPLRYFGRDYVLFRGEDGQPTLLDAHCPHLGAHLGYGGHVEGNDIVCPFHAWRFASSGRCTDVPYASRIPPRAAVHAHPVQEHSGMILACFGPEGFEPDYEVPAIEELDDPAWTPLERAHIEIATQPREVIENIADLAHFLPVHHTLIDDFKVIIDGPRATQRSLGRGRNLKGEPIPVESIATYHGPAIQFTRLGWAFDMVLINAHIPIEENKLLLRFGVSLRAGEGVTLPQEVIEAHVAAARDGYFADVAIWENKCWRDQPVFVDGDGPIGEIRKWYASFFTDATVSC
jgi:3-ketosteroid 9alpha-monooxygenase subunit A